MSRRKRKSSSSEESGDSEEETKSKSKKRSKSDERDSDEENAAQPTSKTKPAPRPTAVRRADTSVDAPEYVTSSSTPSATAKGSRLSADFDYGDGSLEDMQRLMNLYQKDGEKEAGSTGATPTSGSKGKVSQSVLSSTVDDFSLPEKVYTAPKRGRRPGRTDSPASPMDGADDIPDPAAEWLKSFYLGCKECGVDDFSSDNLFVQHHLEVHQNDRPYKCQNLEKDHVTPKPNQDCGSSFRQRHHYKEHIRGEICRCSMDNVVVQWTLFIAGMGLILKICLSRSAA